MRGAAYRLIHKTLNEGGYSNYLFESFVSNNEGLSPKDRAFLKNLFFGVLRKKLLLDKFLSEKCRSPYEKVPEKIKTVLRIGLYQLLFMDRVPAHAAVSESVELAKKHGHAGTVKLVNGLLRALSRESGKILQAIKINSESSLSDISAFTSHPESIVAKYISEFGKETAIKILEANNVKPPRNFRVAGFDRVEKKLKSGVMEKNRFNDSGMEIKEADAGSVLELMRDGLIAPQDQSSLIAVSLLKNSSGPVLELCCGRGNKSEALLEIFGQKNVTVNCDLSIKKLSRFKKDLGSGFNPVCCDSMKPLPFKGKFQTIFLDAPCSNLGTVRRHPELKYRRSLEDIGRSAITQLEMLKTASHFLADSGALLYAVCSFEPEETTGVIENFCLANGSLSIADIGEKRPDLREAGLTDGNFLRIFPGTFGMDGFFAAIIQKEK